MRLSLCTVIAAVVASVASQDAPNILIYGLADSVEDRAAKELGYNTTIVGDADWGNMTTLDFAGYDAIVVPDLNTDSLTSLDFLEKSKDVWSPAITGNIIVIGGDPVNHISNVGAGILISNAVRFAATGRSSPSTTGFYLVLSRIYNNVDNATVDVLSRFGDFIIRGNLDCYDKAHLVASSPALDSLNDTALSNWACSVHEAFASYPTTGRIDFQALAIAQDVLVDGSQEFGDGSVGLPYIISHGATPAACGDGQWDELYGEECDDGNASNGDGCSSSCKCESGMPNGDGTCEEPPSSSGYGPPPSCPKETHRPAGGYGPASNAS
ncbi:uncharacterized protein M421DRAFT_67576 [Didymella exigua CBS 183.55]|uniref:Uncharacterized protein n=1 Tax=Didymella exigua CBS 183.55 TaxID=1150837 RepID=A0A6A5RGX7_9PLEO|nr:uncharacterized protein M421DRAFT_67576 [Didymella exigua CBS 183.55]KAF1926378.1 hypothetical protein M421DRAFT_67576 [Didymella exigua CBS 183.55]